MFGNPETTTGGRALKFYASVRLDIRKIEISKFINYLTKKISIIDIDIDSGNIDNVIIKLYEEFKI